MTKRNNYIDVEDVGSRHLEIRAMKNEPLMNVKNQIGFCGIWCGSCAGGNGATAELARRFEKLAEAYSLEKWAPRTFDFQEFMKGLAAIQTMPLCDGCRKGGGNPTCRVRICALQKGIADCSQCNELIECKNFAQLEKENPRRKLDLLEMRDVDQKELIRKWTSEIETRWPHCILYCAHARK